MNRREFSVAGLSTFFALSCPCARHAKASTTIQGCRMAGTGEATFWDRVLALPPKTDFRAPRKIAPGQHPANQIR